MYEIKIINKVTENGVTSDVEELVHSSDQDSYRRVASCTYSDGINYIQEAQFVLLSTNPAYNNLHELTTLVQIINTRNNKIVFDGRVVKIYNNGMASDGKISKTVKCEGSMAYLCDTVQMCSLIPDPENDHVTSLKPLQSLDYLIQRHNAAVGADKQFSVTGNMTTGVNLSYTTDYRNTFETIKKYILEPAGGELYMSHERNNDGELVLHYDKMYNNVQKSTVIELAHNMVSFEQETDVSNIVTRLIPLGAYREVQYADDKHRTKTKKIKSRYDIYHADIVTPTSEDPVKHDAESFYLDDTNAIAQYGIIVGTVVFDDHINRDDTQEHRNEDANILMAAGKQYLLNNNRIKKSYKAEILDLSLIGLDPDDLEVGASYRFKNSLIPLDEELRLNKITVDIFNAHRPKVEIGEKTEKITNVASRQAQLIEYDLPEQEFDILSSAQENVSNMINDASKGYIYIDNDRGELLIMNTPDKTTANEVWRWNSAGFGFAYADPGVSAYDHGTFAAAITADGGVVSKFVMASEVTAQNLTITGGKIDMQSNHETTDIIYLTYWGNDTEGVYRKGYTKMQPWRFEAGDEPTGNRIITSFTGIYGYYGASQSDISFMIDSETGIIRIYGNHDQSTSPRDDNWISLSNHGIYCYYSSSTSDRSFSIDSETGNISTKGYIVMPDNSNVNIVLSGQTVRDIVNSIQNGTGNITTNQIIADSIFIPDSNQGSLRNLEAWLHDIESRI